MLSLQPVPPVSSEDANEASELALLLRAGALAAPMNFVEEGTVGPSLGADNIRVGVQFTHAGLIGPQIGFNKVKALAEIKKEQKGWLDISYLSEELRICRGDKGTLFVLKKRSDERLFKRFQGFMEKISSKK